MSELLTAAEAKSQRRGDRLILTSSTRISGGHGFTVQVGPRHGICPNDQFSSAPEYGDLT